MDAAETLGVIDAVLRLVADEAPLDLLVPSLAGVVDSAIESTASALHLPGRSEPTPPLGGEPHTALIAAAVDRALSTGETFSLSLPAGTWCSAHVVPVVAGSERVAALVVWSPRPGQFTGDDKAAVDRAVHLAAISLGSHPDAVALRRAERVDPLTGLANERHFAGVLETIAAEPDPGPCAVVVLDVDDFAAINAAIGPDAADHVLVIIGGRLRGAVRSRDLVGRWDGDEFVILCRDVADEAEAAQVADRLSRVVGTPMVVDEHDVAVTVTARWAFAHRLTESSELVSSARGAAGT